MDIEIKIKKKHNLVNNEYLTKQILYIYDIIIYEISNFE